MNLFGYVTIQSTSGISFQSSMFPVCWDICILFHLLVFHGVSRNQSILFHLHILSPDELQLSSGSQDNENHIWEVTSTRQVSTLSGTLSHLCTCFDGSRLAGSSVPHSFQSEKFLQEGTFPVSVGMWTMNHQFVPEVSLQWLTDKLKYWLLFSSGKWLQESVLDYWIQRRIHRTKQATDPAIAILREISSL